MCVGEGGVIGRVSWEAREAYSLLDQPSQRCPSPSPPNLHTRMPACDRITPAQVRLVLEYCDMGSLREALSDRAFYMRKW